MISLWATVVTLVALAVVAVFGFFYRPNQQTFLNGVVMAALGVAAIAAVTAFFAIAVGS